MAIRLKSVAFPSRNFPSADLFFSQGTKYDFSCLKCQAAVTVLLDAPSPHRLSRQEENAVIDHFRQFRKVTRSESYERAACPACGTEYVLALAFTDTSMGATRVTVTDATQMESETSLADKMH